MCDINLNSFFEWRWLMKNELIINFLHFFFFFGIEIGDFDEKRGVHAILLVICLSCKWCCLDNLCSHPFWPFYHCNYKFSLNLICRLFILSPLPFGWFTTFLSSHWHLIWLISNFQVYLFKVGPCVPSMVSDTQWARHTLWSGPADSLRHVLQINSTPLGREEIKRQRSQLVRGCCGWSRTTQESSQRPCFSEPLNYYTFESTWSV